MNPELIKIPLTGIMKLKPVYSIEVFGITLITGIKPSL
jgi:hypothetical protein